MILTFKRASSVMLWPMARCNTDRRLKSFTVTSAENSSKTLTDSSPPTAEANNKGVLHLASRGFTGKSWNSMYGKTLDTFLVQYSLFSLVPIARVLNTWRRHWKTEIYGLMEKSMAVYGQDWTTHGPTDGLTQETNNLPTEKIAKFWKDTFSSRNFTTFAWLFPAALKE